MRRYFLYEIFFQYENDDLYPNTVPTERPDPPEPSGPIDSSALPDSKFKGFEAFLDIENEKDISVPNSMSTKSIRHLSFVLLFLRCNSLCT